MARGTDGFNLSRIGGNEGKRCPWDPDQQPEVEFDFNLREGLVGGDFERGTLNESAGWWGHGGEIVGGAIGILGNNHLELGNGDRARRNRFYLPKETTGIHFCRSVATSSAAASLSLKISREGAADREMLLPQTQNLSKTTGWQGGGPLVHNTQNRWPY